MTEGNVEPSINDAPIFAAELTPYRSLGLRGFKILLMIAGILSLIHIVVFLVVGAWPIVFFFGLDFVLLFGAFWLNYHAARAREEVSVSRTDVSVKKFAPSGRMTEHRFNPFWARFSIKRHQEIGIVSMKISGGGRQTDIGSFLNRDDRETFAVAFARALATARSR
jgi:uncharacterized membrane protein